MIDIYNVKVHFDSLYNAGVKHSLNVYTLKNLCGVIFKSSFSRYIMCKNGFVTMFSLKIIDVFILFTRAPLL